MFFVNNVRDLISESQWSEMSAAIASGQRVGQAFFNTCPEEWRVALRGSVADPFYRDGFGCVVDALDFLTR